jgi:lysophospholipase L1-like esterase
MQTLSAQTIGRSADLEAGLPTAISTANHVVRSNPPTVPRTLRLVAMGDSLVYGYGDSVGGGWVDRLRRRWMEPGSAGHALYNLGVRGDGAMQVRQRLEVEFRSRGELRNRTPDLLLLSVGTNDSARLGRPSGKPYTAPEQFVHEITQLLVEAQTLAPVLFIGMVPVRESAMPFLDCFYYNHRDQAGYAQQTRQICAQLEIPYLDTFALWQSHGADWVDERLLPDGLHPNALGYETLLDQICRWEAFQTAIAL